MLDRETYDHYWTKGWAVVNGVVDPAACDDIAAFALEMCKEDDDNTSAYTRDSDASGTEVAPRKLHQPYRRHERFRAFVGNEKIAALLRELLGIEPLLATDQIFMKPPRFGSAKPYHQDNAYFLCDPPDHVCTAWIALDDVDESNGCLRYIDGSHREGIVEHVPVPGEPHNRAPRPEDIDLSRESLAIVNKGGIVFHHSETLHTSHRNTSDRWRRAYATHWVSAQTTSKGEVLNKAYFNQKVS